MPGLAPLSLTFRSPSSLRLVLGSFVLTLLGCTAPVKLQTPPLSARGDATSMPVRKVQLYEIGVGYFERAGRLSPGKDVLTLPASHVDDALKTMVIFSDGAPLTVSAIQFESVLGEALARVQAGLQGEGSRAMTYPALLESLRGTSVEVLLRNGKRTEGRLAEVAEFKPEKPQAKGTTATNGGASSEDAEAAPPGLAPAKTVASEHAGPRYLITVIETNGAIARFDSTQLDSIRPLEPAIAKRLDSAVATAAGRSAISPRAIRIEAAANVPIRVGYITETPVWRVTYRLILGKAEPASSLQGWVLVHNDTDEPWQNVALEIINGRPNSFLYPIAAPRYLRRPLATPAAALSTLPQLASKTPDQIWGDGDASGDLYGDEIGEAFGAGGLSLSDVGEGGGGRGEGMGFGEARLKVSTSGEIAAGNLANVAKSEALPSGANFHYRVGQPVTLSAHSSALVPFTQLVVNAELMSRFAWGETEGHVAVQVTNESGQTLPAGPIAIFSDDGLAGESSLVRLPSGKATWLSYGIDLDTELEQRENPVERSTTKLLKLENNAELVEHYVRHREVVLRVSNRSTLKRTVCVELPVASNANVVGADRLQYDAAAGRPLAVFELGPRTEQDRSLVLDEALKRSTPLTRLGESKLVELLGSKDLPPRARAILADAATKLAKNAEFPRKLVAAGQRKSQIEAEIDRLEGITLKMKGSEGSQASPLVRRLVELEAARSRIDAEERTLRQAQVAQLPELARILARLNAD